MPQIVKCYDIYLPLKYNDGTEIEIEKYEEVEDELLDQFGGVNSLCIGDYLELLNPASYSPL